MNKALKKFLKSKGAKRLIASFIAALTSLAMVLPIPGINEAIAYLQALAGSAGAIGIADAGLRTQALGKEKLATASSVFSFLLLLAHWIPALQPYVVLLQQLAGGLGIAAISAKATQK